jgi:hypothetical protein
MKTIIFKTLAISGLIFLSSALSAQTTEKSKSIKPAEKPALQEAQKKNAEPASPSEYSAPAAPKSSTPINTQTNNQPEPSNAAPSKPVKTKPVNKTAQPASLAPQQRVIIHEGTKDPNQNSPK